ncbi:helix-turn-helix domain-containing protein [Cytobacillus gottheilii]|uniref:helix-turn-helix domain-containing protein n=1 Tax=Cytobacillus gottheilii TaxID=859144 RepID=UPI002494B588|nr:helix-turn-helix transcriptional regulator [Cytobacillus gottheilii]
MTERMLNLNFIKDKRQELEISLQDMADKLGFKHASTYMKYEKGIYLFKANHLPLLANQLRCKTIEELFFEN